MKCERAIMIVEDDAAVRETLRDLLEVEGYTVVTAENGAEALQLLHRATSPCLILLDLMMPVMDGWQFLDALRDSLGEPTIPVAVLSAVTELSDVQSRYRRCQVIKKPVRLDSIVATAREHCGAPG